MTQAELDNLMEGYYWAKFRNKVQPVQISGNKVDANKTSNIIWGIGFSDPLLPEEVKVIWPMSSPDSDIVNQVLGT